MRISDWSSDVCSSDLLVAALDELRGNFDIIILDGPPVLGLADAPLIASIVGNAVFVVEASRGHRGATKTALRRLRTGHAHILGAVLTKFDPKKSASTYNRSEEHTSELQSLMRISYAVFCLKKKTNIRTV